MVFKMPLLYQDETLVFGLQGKAKTLVGVIIYKGFIL